MKKSRNILFILVVMVVISIIVSCSPADNRVKTSGIGLSFSSFQKLDGWIYYVDYSTGKLWKVGADGEERMQIGDDMTPCFLVDKGRVLFLSAEGWRLCNIGTDGSNRVMYPENGAIQVKKMDIVDGWFYSLNFGNYLYKIKIPDTEFVELSNPVVGLSNRVNDFYIDGEWIYYVTAIPHEKEFGVQLWRMRTDGTQNEQLMKGVGRALDYDRNWTYYMDMDDQDIYKVSFDGKEKHKIVEREGGYGAYTLLKVIGDWVYYVDFGDKAGLYKVKTDGSERTFITDNVGLYYVVWDNWLLCLDPNRISAIKVGESEETDEIIKEILSGWPNTEIYE